ncbi:hypothetical protein DPSP01_013524 [Paraphaeosphaeria sporulosa]|uniref:CFEM domain-containing protein n=1 Tax=Paraphaeosphaeria sporulosa TaxID=1460663 RepID=A0A177CKA7_9PLEO|nr:uncharacterized protein CC84DRAFT_1203470 [Paraphaeosphaeria sporulosa]OAG07955.1 hypothetical protein CC84DRAFT_1203470 [Paraphaeosphaeria sporulosa]
MRFSLFALAAAATLAAAQDLSDIPTCALSCFAIAVPASGCSLTDTTCQCTTGKDKIQESITKCIPDKCEAADIAKVAPAVAKLCAAAGITLSDLPTGTAVSASGASNTASATGSASKTASGSASATSGAASSTASGAVQATGAAVANGLGLGAVVFGLAAAML